MHVFLQKMKPTDSKYIIPLSVLDLAPILQGKTVSNSFDNSLQLARHAETLGFNRFWLAEHHNMESIASSATSILIGYIANGTSKIRVGSGGIMLPNHSPLIVAEQFGTLESLFPGRIDLGLGRAPGTDQLTAMALRRDRSAGMNFEENISELRTYFSSDNKTARVRAIPGEGLDIPIYILGSSTDSAYLSAKLGLPYAFASHFAPDDFLTAIQIYRQHFRPSQQLQSPYVMACVNVIAADTKAEADFIATSFMQLAKGIITGERKPLPPPVKDLTGIVSDFELAAIMHRMKYSFIGDKNSLREKLQQFIKATQINELMAVSHIFDPAARIRSYSLLAEAMKG